MEKNSLRTTRRIVLIGGSAGSLDVILRFLPQLNTDLPFSIVLVLHRRNNFDSGLTDLFSGRANIPVKEADEKEELLPGHIYIAPADYHLLIEKDGTLSIDFSERIHYSRPSIDATFETAAEAYGAGAVGILLSGANSDGTAGLKAIHSKGGITVVQDPASAEIAYMPNQALAATVIDFIIDKHQLGPFINEIPHLTIPNKHS